ncbi:MAG: PilC/PilY family type IV pilus protein [Candidatus Nitrospinota bacterium M3_3B_026]
MFSKALGAAPERKRSLLRKSRERFGKTVMAARILPIVLTLAAAGLLAGDSLVGDPKEACAQSLPTGCVAGGQQSVTEGSFDAADYDLTSVSVVDGKLTLQTGLQTLDPNNIVIPFDQDVSAVFLLEGAGYKSSLGWFVKDEAETKLGGPISGTLNFSSLVSAGVTINYLFRTIEDDQETGGCCSGGDGVLDSIYDASDNLLWSGSTGALSEAGLTSYGFSPNNDSTVDPRDMRVSLGNFSGGTEIVFFIHADDDISGKTFYSKDDWSADTWAPTDSDRDDANLVFDLSIAAPENGGPAAVKDFTTTPTTVTQGFVPTAARDRLGNPEGKGGYPANGYFDLQLSGTISKTVSLGTKYNHFIAAAPPDDPFRWVIGVEDLIGGGDADFNDLVFLVERKTGGVAQLKASEAMSPADVDAYITSVTFGVHDFMPSSSCGKDPGITRIIYYLSVDAGGTWVEILPEDWDVAQTPDKGGTDVSGWTYGDPEETYRRITVNFLELGLSGRELLWKAEMLSGDENCVPDIRDVEISYEAAKNEEFSRSSPSIVANVIYDASFETPAAGWTDRELRGHLTSTRLYDPTNPLGGYATALNWDAGQVVTATGPAARSILYPDMTVTQVTNELIGTGDGSTTTFTGTLADSPVVHSTISISDGVEIFIDKRTKTLEGSLTGTGTINRYTGEFSITFNTAPPNGAAVLADYQWYSTSPTMMDFTPVNVTKDMLALDNSTYTDETGTHYTYDFNEDDTFSEDDADWLVGWTQGYRDGTATPKEWLLGAVDHSTPAVVGAPGLPSWYYGLDVSDDDRDSFDQYRCLQRKRKTVAFVGTKAGLLEAFYAGEYRPYHVDETMLDATDPCGVGDPANLDLFRGVRGTASAGAINTQTISDPRTGNKVPVFPGNSVTGAMQMIISRGYYDWVTRSGSTLNDAGAPNYGDGSELYAILPLNLMGKLKNNALEENEQAAVDASPTVAHVKFDTAAGNPWRTVMITAEGNGGDTVFGIDVTDPDNPLFLWEFSDPDLYRSRSSPSVGPIGRIWSTSGEKWVTFFVSGVNNDPALYPSIYMLDVQTGEVLERIYLDSTALGLGGTPSGQPAAVDSDGNGFWDRMYIGTDKGFMYKIVLPDKPDSATYSIDVCTLFDAGQPIYASPAVMIRNTTNAAGETEYKVDLFFGTSDSPYQIDATGETYYFYAIRDDDNKGTCGAGTMLWNMALPPGHRVFASAFATAGRVYFGTTTADTDDPCSPTVSGATGSGMIYALDVVTDETSPTVVHSEEVGNVTTTPIVEDQHLYIKTGNGELEGRGGGDFQHELKKGGFGDVSVSSWSEVFSE